MSFASGSSGNCYYIGNGKQGLIIDAGVSVKKLKRTLESRGVSAASFSAVLLTHDHFDHIRNLGSFCKKLSCPVYATKKIHDTLAHRFFAGPHLSSVRRNLEEGKWNEIGEFSVRYFEVPHDATQTVGFAIKYEGHFYVHMTDIGAVTEEALSFSKKATTIVIESNYDEDMLFGGKYTEELKNRISGGYGHLSNSMCAEAIRQIYHEGLKNIFLCHLSRNNNTPELAYKSALDALSAVGIKKGEINLRTLPGIDESPLITL